jgi:hypothetical protein
MENYGIIHSDWMQDGWLGVQFPAGSFPEVKAAKVMLTTYFNVVPRSRLCGAIPTSPYTLSWNGLGTWAKYLCLGKCNSKVTGKRDLHTEVKQANKQPEYPDA